VLQPVEIIPEHVYDDGAVITLLGITESSLARARATGELKYTRKGKRVFYLGSWIIEWMNKPSTQDGGNQ
jgi:hypothetical protein